MTPENKNGLGAATQIDRTCIEIEFTNHVQQSLQLDSPSVLLEIRAGTDIWGVFYSAKGLQWDLWSDSFEDALQSGINFAVERPLEAGYQLLSNCPRPDFNYVPEEE
jgi:hypothetical protein